MADYSSYKIPLGYTGDWTVEQYAHIDATEAVATEVEGMGTVVTYDIGTSGGTVPLLSGANTWGAAQYLQLGAQGTPSLAFTGDTNTGIYSPSADTVAISTGGTEKVRIDSAGYVAVGWTASPLYQMTISGLGQETPNLVDSGNKAGSLYLRADGVGAGSGGALLFGSTFGNKTPFAAIKGHITDGSTNTAGHLAISTRNAVSDTALTERARVTYNGNVLIGTTTDDGVSKLQVNGNVTIVPPASATPASNGHMVFELTNNTTLKIKVKGSDGVVRSTTLTLA